MARLKLKLQLYCGDEIAMGPGKADLLEAIAREGSISAAGRALGMSYRRAWLLVDTMNRCFRAPLVEKPALPGWTTIRWNRPFGRSRYCPNADFPTFVISAKAGLPSRGRSRCDQHIALGPRFSSVIPDSC
jgi:hypothetical protein